MARERGVVARGEWRLFCRTLGVEVRGVVELMGDMAHRVGVYRGSRGLTA